MGVHGRWRDVCARDRIVLNPPGHRSKRLYMHRFLAGKQGKRFDDEVRHLSLEPWSTAGIFFVRALQMNVGCAPFSV